MIEVKTTIIKEYEIPKRIWCSELKIYTEVDGIEQIRDYCSMWIENGVANVNCSVDPSFSLKEMKIFLQKILKEVNDALDEK